MFGLNRTSVHLYRLVTYLLDDPRMLHVGLIELCWLTESGRFTHKVVTRPAVTSSAVTGFKVSLNHFYI